MRDEPAADVAAVVIGRNEGARLIACLESLAPQVGRVVYVDSGSTDGSAEAAAARGAEVVALDPCLPFTAARARNAGVARLEGAVPEEAEPQKAGPEKAGPEKAGPEKAGPEEAGLPPFVQFVDGDCTLAPGWIAAARAALAAEPDLAIVCGRRRERHPEASVWNRLADREWDTPVGEATACGGDALTRAAAFREVGGFDAGMIAGEEPELCVRLRQAGWRVRRIDAEMTTHDAGLTRFGQWWRRTRRAGYAYALGAHRHGAPPERHCVRELRRALLWGAALPFAAALGALASPWALALLLAYPLQVVRLAWREGDWAAAFHLVIGKPAEALGVAAFLRDRLLGRAGRIIEYK
jgi:GT2 family glycosyltransferase